MKHVFRLHVKSIHVVQFIVGSLGDDRQRPEIAFLVSRPALDSPGNDGIAHHSNAVGIRDHDWPIEQSGVVHPVDARHLAIPIQAEKSSEHGIPGTVSAGKDCGHPGSHWANTNLERPFAGNQGGVPNLDAFHVGDSV
jgi:hypothetical protein